MKQAPELETSRRKRVIFLVTKSVFGGAQRYVYDLATSLPKDSYDIAVAFGGTGIHGSEPGILKGMLEAVGIRTIFLPDLGRDIVIKSDYAGYKALRALFRKERPDIVHLNSSKAGGLGALAARLSGVERIIFTAHGWPSRERVMLIERFVRYLLSYATLLLSHSVICVSEYDCRAMARMPFAKKKLHIIHNAIRPTQSLSREDARAALLPADVVRKHAQDVWIVSVAEFTMNKNLFRSIDAVTLVNGESRARKKAKRPSIFYCIIGDGEQRAAIEGYREQRATRDTVMLLGTVPESRRYLAAFDAALLPSLKEGFPYFILEAGSAGLPVAASETGGIPEIITHEDTGILIADPRSARSIADALRPLLNETTRHTLGENIKARIERDFSFETMRQQTFALYETPTVKPLLARNRRAPLPH